VGQPLRKYEICTAVEYPDTYRGNKLQHDSVPAAELPVATQIMYALSSSKLIGMN